MGRERKLLAIVGNKLLLFDQNYTYICWQLLMIDKGILTLSTGRQKHNHTIYATRILRAYVLAVQLLSYRRVWYYKIVRVTETFNYYYNYVLFESL